MYRMLLIAVLLCATISGFARRKIDIEDQFRSLKPPVEMFIDDESKELTLDLGKGQQNVRVVITDLSGNNIFNVEISMDSIYIYIYITIEGKWKQYNGDEFWVNLPTK